MEFCWQAGMRSTVFRMSLVYGEGFHPEVARG